MALSFIASTAFNANADDTGFSINKPTGTVDGDIMFAFLIHQDIDSSGYATGVPSGWTSLGKQLPTSTTYYIELFYKIASSEGSSYTFTFTGSISSRTSCTMVTYRGGFNISSPIDVVSNTIYTGGATAVRAETMNVTAANSPLIFFGFVASGGAITFTKPSVPNTSWVEDYDNGGANGGWTEVCSMTFASSGATGTMEATSSSDGSPNKGAMAVALKPEVLSNGNFLMFM